MLLNRDPSPVETYNDLDGDVVNFFRVLRDDKDRLIEAIELTPFSREEYLTSLKREREGVSNLERARLFYVRARQVRTGLAQTASQGQWAYCRLTSAAGMSMVISRWLGGARDLSLIAQRLLRVQIEHDLATNVIRRYDSAETLFYCDPPYPHESRTGGAAYKYEMTNDDHTELSRVLHEAQGRVALSGYRCDLNDTLYGDWHRTDGPEKRVSSANQLRTESLWTNYKLQLFD